MNVQESVREAVENSKRKTNRHASGEITISEPIAGAEERTLGADSVRAMWEGYGEKVTDPKEIVPAIRRAAANGEPSIINVEVDEESLSPFIEGDATMVAPSA